MAGKAMVKALAQGPLLEGNLREHGCSSVKSVLWQQYEG